MARLYVYLAVLAIIGTLTGSAYLKGRTDGRWLERMVQVREVQKLNDALDKKDRELSRLEQDRLFRIRELEILTEELRRQADEDPNADRPAFGADSMRRLNAVH